MPGKLTTKFRKRFDPRPEGVPPPKFKVGDLLQVMRGRYAGMIGRIEDYLWDGAKQLWVYTAYDTDRQRALNPYENEVRIYHLPPAVRKTMQLSSARAFPAPAWLSVDEKAVWGNVFDDLFLTGQPVDPAFIGDGLAQVALFARHTPKESVVP